MSRESENCTYCHAVTNLKITQLVVGKGSITTKDIPMCKGCKKAFEAGYEMGVRDA